MTDDGALELFARDFISRDDRLVAVALGAPRLADAMAFTIDNA